MTILWCLAPYTLLLIGSFMASLLPVRKAGAEKVSDLEILFLCTIISTAAMLSSFSSKLPIYLVPVLRSASICSLPFLTASGNADGCAGL